jgi:hypothetical protein
MKKTLAIFILVGSSLIGLSKINAQTAPSGTLTASPQNVTVFTNENGAGNTKLSWSTENSIKTMITLIKTKKTGEIIPATGGTILPNGEKIIYNNPTLNKTDYPINYIQKNVIHTFKLYAGITTSTDITIPAAITLGAYLGEFIVYGYDH